MEDHQTHSVCESILLDSVHFEQVVLIKTCRLTFISYHKVAAIKVHSLLLTPEII